MRPSAATVKLVFLYPLNLPDEWHVSQAGRFHEASGNATARQTCEQLYDSGLHSAVPTPQRLVRFAEKLPGSINQNVERLLRQNTLFPLFETFGNATLGLAQDGKPIEQALTDMPSRLLIESKTARLCVNCLGADRAEQGCCYIHRAHQVPGVQVCWRHRTRLIDSCPICGCPFQRKFGLVLAPWEPCKGCGSFLAEAAFYKSDRNATRHEIGYARFAYDVLVNPTRHLPANQLATIYKTRLAQEGFTWGSSRVARSGLSDALEKHFGKEALGQIDNAYRNRTDPPRFVLGGAPSTFEAPVSRHLALSYFLFGSAKRFWAFANATPAAEESTPKTSSSSTSISGAATKRYSCRFHSQECDRASENDDQKDLGKRSVRSKLEAIIQSSPELTESEVWRTHPGLMKELVQSHPDALAWLKARLEASRNAAGKRSSLEAKRAKRDAQWAQAIGTAATALYASIEKPTKVTRSVLLRKTRRPTGAPNPETYPFAYRQLESLKESEWHYYARRIIWAKFKAPPGAPQWMVVGRIAGIEHHQGYALFEFFAAFRPTGQLLAGTIMNVLAEYGIAKNWEGPMPDRVFERPGRNHVAKRSKRSLQ
jgi:hypothetical protein